VPLQAALIPPAGDSGRDGRSTPITGIQFDLTHNDDLLSFQSASGLTRVNHPLPPPWKGGGITDTFVASPLLFKEGAGSGLDTIGSLAFQVYLTDSSETPLTLSNILLSTPGFEPDCIATIDSNSSGFTYLYRCGDSELQGFLQTGTVPLQIESIVPIPANASLRVEGSGQNVEAELFDALGRETLPPTLHPLPFTLDVSSLPSGTYFLRLSQNGYVQSREISIER
jgi:hypothetical protein